jgi:hypothetical protein
MAYRDGEEPPEGDPLLDFAPVPHKRPRRNSIGPERQKKFIAALAATGIVREAAAEIGASVEALYKLRQWPGAGEFSAAWDAAVDRGVMRIEDGALARAIEGEERMVVSGGKLLGIETRYNEALVMFFLRNRRPERYRTELAADLRPGHPLYERIKAEVLAEADGDEAEVLESIDRFLEDMRERRLANEKLFAEQAEEDRRAGQPDGGDEET